MWIWSNAPYKEEKKSKKIKNKFEKLKIVFTIRYIKVKYLVLFIG